MYSTDVFFFSFFSLPFSFSIQALGGASVGGWGFFSLDDTRGRKKERKKGRQAWPVDYQPRLLFLSSSASSVYIIIRRFGLVSQFLLFLGVDVFKEVAN